MTFNLFGEMTWSPFILDVVFHLKSIFSPFLNERKLIKNGISIRNIEEGRNVSMYKTNIQCNPVGVFHCPMIVSMRPVPKERVQDAIEITKTFTETHGEPIHTGNPEEIGIKDLSIVDFGESVTIKENEVPCCNRKVN
jgi:uncharacterized protein YcsI (UPF0317 family)